MANSKFDYGKLSPETEWDESKLNPIEEENYSIPYKNPTGLQGISKDIKGIPGNIADYLIKVPQMVGESYQQIKQNPVQNIPRAGRGLMGGLLEGLKQTYNLPLHLNTYLGSKDIPFFKQMAPYAEKLKIGETGLQNLIQGKTQKGDEFWNDLGMILGPAKVAELLPGVNTAIKKIPGIEKSTEKIKEIRKLPELQKSLGAKQSDIEAVGAKANEVENMANLAAEESKNINDLGSDEISSYLNKGAAHNVRAAKSLAHRFNNIENYWKDSYRKLKNDVKSNNFQLPNLPSYANDVQHAITNIKDLEFVNGKLVLKNKPPEMSAELKSIVDSAPKPKDTSADTFMTKYQDFRDARYDLLQRAKSADTASERKHLFEVYNETKPLEETISNTLEEGLGNYKDEFKRVNKGYSEQVFPLRGNAAIKKALKGKMGPNIIEDVAGFGEGQEIVRDMIKQDPELLRNVLGQRYAENPSKLHNIDESSAEFLNEVPEVQKIMDKFSEISKQKLEEVNKHKENRNISLKKKLDLEHEVKILSQRIKQIEKDKSRIRKGVKIGAYGTGALLLGTPVASHVINKIKRK